MCSLGLAAFTMNNCCLDASMNNMTVQFVRTLHALCTARLLHCLLHVDHRQAPIQSRSLEARIDSWTCKGLMLQLAKKLRDYAELKLRSQRMQRFVHATLDLLRSPPPSKPHPRNPLGSNSISCRCSQPAVWLVVWTSVMMGYAAGYEAGACCLGVSASPPPGAVGPRV